MSKFPSLRYTLIWSGKNYCILEETYKDTSSLWQQHNRQNATGSGSIIAGHKSVYLWTRSSCRAGAHTARGRGHIHTAGQSGHTPRQKRARRPTGGSNVLIKHSRQVEASLRKHFPRRRGPQPLVFVTTDPSVTPTITNRLTFVIQTVNLWTPLRSWLDDQNWKY